MNTIRNLLPHRQSLISSMKEQTQEVPKSVWESCQFSSDFSYEKFVELSCKLWDELSSKDLNHLKWVLDNTSVPNCSNKAFVISKEGIHLISW